MNHDPKLVIVSNNFTEQYLLHYIVIKGGSNFIVRRVGRGGSLHLII